MMFLLNSNMHIAIISFFHTESSICLAKYLAKCGNYVDFYYVSNLLHDRRTTSGFEYLYAKKSLGNHLLSYKECTEIYSYVEGLPVRFFLSRIIHHERYPWINRILMRINMLQVRNRHYDAINIVGQTSWIHEAHDVLKKENLIHTFHELGQHDGPLVPLSIIRRAIEDHSKVILHSKITYDRFLSISGSEQNRTKMIPFGKFETLRLYVKEADLELPFPSIDKPLLLFYGFLLPYKGLDVLAKSLSLLEDIWDRFNLIIAGNGNDASLPFFQTLPNCHIINRYLSNDEMMNLIRQSSAILLPYKSASQTGIIPTCALYGKPCIATRVGAFSEMIQDGKNGVLVEPNNPTAYANAIHRIVFDSSLRSTLSEGAARFGENDKYSWEIIAEQTINFYSE